MAPLIINGPAQNQTLSGTLSYDSVSITNGGTLFVTPYNGTAPTGKLILNVSGDVNVDSTSSIIADARGHLGGAGGSTSFTCEGGYGGEQIGCGYGCGSGQNGSNGVWSYSGGGGGGGGSYGLVGSAGGKGGDWAGGAYIGGAGGSAGSIFGTQTGSDIDMGAGSGGGGREGGTFGTNGNPGGGMLTINANNIYIHGTISSNGGTGGAGGAGNGGGGGGGGASGGGILLNSNNIMNLSSAIIRANGGAGGAAGTGYAASGGTGGGGRVKIFYGTTYTAPAQLSAGTTYVQLLMGNASFSSNPSGATIWIDGSNTGITTPNTISNLATGGHNYTLKLTGYTDVTGSFSVTANQTTTVPTATFAGSASITSLPSGARIYLAASPGTPADQGVTTPSTFTSLTAASSGASTLWNYRLTSTGYADATGSFTATAGSTISVPVTFPPSASFTSTPSGARIWIDGIDKGLNTPNTVIGLTAGSRNYRMVLTGYADATGSFTATGGSTTVVPTVTFAPSATFASTPSGASIYIDNILQTGVTPATITGLTVGSHTYKLFLAGYNAVTGNFTPVAGTTTSLPTTLLIGTAMAFLSAGD